MPDNDEVNPDEVYEGEGEEVKREVDGEQDTPDEDDDDE